MPVEAHSRDDWNAVRDGLQPRAAEGPLFPFEIDPATCTQGLWSTYLGLGSAWIGVHQTEAGTCEVWLGGETEDPRYDGRPTSYCALPQTCEPLAASLPFDDGGPARLDSPYCTSPGLAPSPPCDLERAVLSACVTGPGIEEARPFEEPYTLSVEGVVEQVGVRGEDDCFRSETARVGRWIAHQAVELDTARWISMRTTEGDLFQVGVITPGFMWRVQPGDPVAVELRSLLFPFAPDQSNIEVRGPGDGLVYWLGLAGSLEELTPPSELTFVDGGIECRDSGECFEERRFHRVEIKVDGATETVGYGDGATIGQLQVVHGGLESQYGASMCLDAYVAWASISAWNPPPAPLGRTTELNALLP